VGGYEWIKALLCGFWIGKDEKVLNKGLHRGKARVLLEIEVSSDSLTPNFNSLFYLIKNS